MVERVSYMDNNFIRFPNAYVHVVFVTDLTIATCSWFTSAAVLIVIGINIPVNDNPTWYQFFSRTLMRIWTDITSEYYFMRALYQIPAPISHQIKLSANKN